MTDQVNCQGIQLQEAVLKALKNMGHDTTCGTCMSIAFTGTPTGMHTCKRVDISMSEDQYTWLLATLRQHARNLFVSLGNRPSAEVKAFLELLNTQQPHALATMPDMGII